MGVEYEHFSCIAAEHVLSLPISDRILSCDARRHTFYSFLAITPGVEMCQSVFLQQMIKCRLITRYHSINHQPME
jgi:hypothetical protein